MIVAATGHRPNKLGGYSPEAGNKLRIIAYQWLMENKPSKVITGMALGWDQAITLACFQAGIPYIAAVPFKGQHLMWPQNSQNLYISLLLQSDHIEYVCNEGYAAWKMQKRNEWMVDRADLILAMWDGSSGGTGNCIKYAQSKNKQIINLYPELNK